MERTSAGQYLLTVLTGPNAGAQVDLAARKISVGASHEDDVILDGFVGPSIEIAVSKDKMRVLTARDDAAVIDAGPIKAGKPSYANLPATVQASRNIQINLCRKQAVRPRRSYKWAIAACLVLGLGIGGHFALGSGNLATISNAFAKIDRSAMPFENLDAEMIESIEPEAVAAYPEDMARAMNAENIALDEIVPEPAALPVAVPKPTESDALADLNGQIEEAGLTGLSAELESGMMRVSGIVMKSQTNAWKRVRDAYDGQFGQVAPLLVSMTEEADTPPVTVSSVWLGDQPELSTRDGQILRKGDTTESGWIVTVIAASEVHLERGKQRVVIEF